jgi:type IV pilus assembly protein PilY1
MSTMINDTSTGRAKWHPALRRWVWSAGAAVYMACSALVSGGPLTLPSTPPFLTGGVPPNLIMAIDDSTSMDLELLMEANDGSAWWIRKNGNPNATGGSCANPSPQGSFTGCTTNGSTNVPGTGKLNYNHFFNNGAPWVRYSFLFPNGLNTGAASYQRRAAQASVAPIGDFAWARSVEYNTGYFDPAQTYKPWVSNGSFTFGDSDPGAARPDPVYPSLANAYGRFDLTKDIASTAGIGALAGAPVGVNPDRTVTGTVCSAITTAWNTDYGFAVYDGMTLPEGTCFRRANTGTASLDVWQEVTVGSGGCPVNGAAGSCKTSASAGGFVLADAAVINIRYFPATFYASAAGAPPAAFGYTATAVADGKAPDGSTMYRYEIKPGNFTTGVEYERALQNFANWFTYYRKRHQALRAGLGQAFSTVNGMRVGGFTINAAGLGGSPSTPDVNPAIIDATGAGTTNRQNLYTNFYQTWMNTLPASTPNRAGIANIIRNYKRSSGPVTNSCQRNYGMLFTDGFANVATVPADGAAVLNADGSSGSPYADSVLETMADRVMNAYSGADATAIYNAIPAASRAPNRVRVPKACADGTASPWVDCNKNPHMNFYALTLGTPGILFDPSIPNIEDVDYVYNNTVTWRASLPPDRHASAVDDLWHAAVNGRGQLFIARKATDLGDKLSAVLNNVTDLQGSAASAAVSSGTVSTSIQNRTFVVSFDPNDWSGSLTALELTYDTTIGAKVDGIVNIDPNAREIFTVNTNNAAVPFRWANLDGTRQGQLNSVDSQGVARLDFLRGARSNEKPLGQQFRKRSALKDSAGVDMASPLGDIINSAPVYVGAPNFRYKDSLEVDPYSTWAASKVARMPMVYVGANDGMLHAFSVPNKEQSPANPRGKVDVTGAVTEEFAFIPGTVFKNLPELSKANYAHMNYVDGTPSVVDAYFTGDWHTVLVGGLNLGGQGIYALDVTDPMGIDEANAGSAFMWEFTDEDDADLGYTFSRPAVVRLHNGEWGVVFGNGYGSDMADTYLGDGVATLYVLRLSDGFKLAEIKLPSTPADLDTQMVGKTNGLSTPAVVDYEGDDIVDAAYVGDLYGNLWKIDLSSSNPAAWGAAFASGGAPEPLFVAINTDGKRQPITSRPQVGRGPNGNGHVVLFGTGKYLESSDKGSTTKQSFYGIYDLGATVTRGQLQQQSITTEYPVVSPVVRITSNNTVSAAQRGWYFDLLNGTPAGEMQITDSVLRSGRIAFTTLIPDLDPCNFGGKSWFMLLDALTGARLPGSSFDVNKDGNFDTGDLVGGLPVSGVFSDAIMSQPRFVSAPAGDIGIVTKTDNQTDRFLIKPGVRVGRQSWRQLR